ncbi:MAG TPA: nickel pincer cofactor biosynthesis protein LarC [Terriglobales bacterium]|nr:nickel pincer cofactor biosynthesis protein LarC [Terriglobales bacterium]
MRIAYLDCFSGISGDMFLGALIDAGVSPGLFETTVAALGVGARLKISRVNRSGISATKVDVIVDDQAPKGAAGTPAAAQMHLHEHEHSHSHDDPHHHSPYGHSHAHAHEHSQPNSEQEHADVHDLHGRGLVEIRQLITKAGLSETARKTAAMMFEKLGAAESKIHNVPIETIHFHEVGAVDAIVDIACAAVGAEALGVDEFVCSPLNVGGGTIECAHGTFPVPAPATVELLQGSPVYSSGLQAELVTPTGAAIVSTLATRFAAFPPMKIERSGYGAGTRDFRGHANVLRITIGKAAAETTAGEGVRATHIAEETICVMEANLDDLNPQVFGYVMDRLLEAGALDVFATPVQMKKSRPGTLLTVLTKPEDEEKMLGIVFAETTTLGVRRREEKRQALARKWETVPTRFGDVRIKIASMNGSVTSYAPEYEDCRRIASEQRVPLKLVMQEAVQEYLQSGRAINHKGL